MGAFDLSSYLWPEAEQARQPQSLGPVSPYWLSRGLYCAYVGGFGNVLNGVSAIPTDTKLTIGRSGMLASQATAGTCSTPIRFPRRVLNARTDLFMQECTTRRNYGRWLTGEIGSEGWSGEYSNTELGWTIHGSGWNTSAKVFDAQSPVSLVGAPRTICGVWNKDKNSGYGRVFVDGREVVRTAGTALTGVSDRTQSSASVVLGAAQSVSGIALFLAFSTDLEPAEVRSLSENPWQVFTPLSIPFTNSAQVSLPTLGRAVADTSTGLWIPSTGTSLFECINEEVPSDENYITVTDISTCELVLNETAFPLGDVQTISYRASSQYGSTLTVTLKQGSTTIASWTHALTVIDTLYSQSLTAPQVSLITAGALSVQLTAS